MIVQRQAVRAILLTPEDEVLLLRIRPPEMGAPFWITPGGGLNPGESTESALHRELREELGLDDPVLGPLLWRRQHTFNWAGRRICQHERFYAIHVLRFEPRMTDPAEAQFLDRFRWWPVAELGRSQEQLTPRSLADIVHRYLVHGAPRDPLEVEVLVD